MKLEGSRLLALVLPGKENRAQEGDQSCRETSECVSKVQGLETKCAEERKEHLSLTTQFSSNHCN